MPFLKSERENGYTLTLLGVGVFLSNSFLIYFANHSNCLKLKDAYTFAGISFLFVTGFLSYIAQTHPKLERFKNFLTFLVFGIVGLFYGLQMVGTQLSLNYFCDFETGRYFPPDS